METRVKVQRLESWTKRLKSLPTFVRQESNAAARTNAEFFVREARRQVEVDTGELEGTIRAYEAEGSLGSIWRAVAGNNGGRGFYARFREFGTVVAQADPFFFTTYRAMRRSFQARNARALKKAHKRAAKK